MHECEGGEVLQCGGEGCVSVEGGAHPDGFSVAASGGRGGAHHGWGTDHRVVCAGAAHPLSQDVQALAHPLSQALPIPSHKGD